MGDEVVSRLEDTEKKIMKMKNVNSMSHTTGVAGLSVAVESTKLWVPGFTEEDHYFNSLVSTEGGSRRKLTDTADGIGDEDWDWDELEWRDIILADVNGTMANVIDMITGL